MKNLSPLRNTTKHESAKALASEQLAYFDIDPNTEYGRSLVELTEHLYSAQHSLDALWSATSETLPLIDRSDKVRYFNAKKFLAFQIAKLLDNLQNPFRATYQQLNSDNTTKTAKGSFPLFDNVPALFSATPVVTKTATYIYACTEWVDDAFHGKEPTHQIYSRLLNPTSISLANAIVDLKAGPYTNEYLAWNFNSGMAAIDCVLSNVLRRGDVLIVARNVYGGSHQLLVDYFAQENRLAIQIEWFDGYSGDEFNRFLEDVQKRHHSRLNDGKKLHVYVESPCNPHGLVLDVPKICARAHQDGHKVILDSTLATPFLNRPLQRKNPAERPDYVIHSYTKDLAGTGAATAGVVIGKIETMFGPKGHTTGGVFWQDTMFWDVYYIKGAFLDADKAYEVLTGMKTLEQRMLHKCVSTRVFTRFLASHSSVNVSSNAIETHPNHDIMSELHYLGLPAPLFSFDLEKANLPTSVFKQFFDSLEPTFSHQVSIGQPNTLVLCPALTSHSELSSDAMIDAGIFNTTIRVSMGLEDVRELAAHIVTSAKIHIDPVLPGFSDGFNLDSIDDWLKHETQSTLLKHIESAPTARQRIEG